MSNISISVVSMDNRTVPDCLVRYVGKLEVLMEQIFPGKFYPYNAEFVFEAYTTGTTENPVIMIGNLRCTNEMKMNEYISNPSNRDQLLKVLSLYPGVRKLYDFRLQQVVEAKDLWCMSAPKGKGTTLYRSTKGIYYCFDVEGWITTTLNFVGMEAVPTEKNITETGKMLYGMLCDVYGGFDDVKDYIGLSTGIRLVSVPNGNSDKINPERMYHPTSLDALRAYAERNKDKLRPELKLPDDNRTKILLSDLRTHGASALLSQSLVRPSESFIIEIDQDTSDLYTGYIKAGKIHFTVFDVLIPKEEQELADSLGVYVSELAIDKAFPSDFYHGE